MSAKLIVKGECRHQWPSNDSPLVNEAQACLLCGRRRVLTWRMIPIVAPPDTDQAAREGITYGRHYAWCPGGECDCFRASLLIAIERLGRP